MPHQKHWNATEGVPYGTRADLATGSLRREVNERSGIRRGDRTVDVDVGSGAIASLEDRDLDREKVGVVDNAVAIGITGTTFGASA
jgi:hypothetical protein